jgi:hypothetical protein
MPSFSINVVSLEKAKSGKRWRWTPATFVFPPGRSPEQQWIRLPDRRLLRVAEKMGAPSIFQGSAYFPYLPARSEFAAQLELGFEHRGRYQQESFGLATRFPFAFLTKTRRVPLNRETIVYPAVEPSDEFLEALPLVIGEFETFARGRGHDLYRIREYMPEDPARHVDWKATAKSGSLKVREFSRGLQRRGYLSVPYPLGDRRTADLAIDDRGHADLLRLQRHFDGAAPGPSSGGLVALFPLHIHWSE